MSARTILISCTREERALPYLEALRAVGIAGEDVRVVHPENTSAADAGALAAQAAGLLLCGGPDLEPHHYGETPHADANLSFMPERDALELALLAGARTARTPTFGVCRGLQMTNAFLGGTLWQDIQLMSPSAVTHDLEFPKDALIHEVQVLTPENGLGALLLGEPRVNSRHHQAIKDLAPDLDAVAVAPDGIVEAVAGKDPRWWLWGVQWHPENLVALEGQRGLFARFRDEARAHGAALSASATDRHEPALR